ncbi:MAG: pilus assembly protein TadB [Cellulomonas sp. 73-92]|uniref:type II secretion system F family protein n=1 Tax=Cellulomonas sp. 73-92 TaxID=1895740 RepID=UPI00092C05F7|nr:type II secretion system F family protein [Cellulomonas sp. 73-92]OJV78958.1 MAG: pilus assembly protein TadB [Cellulomonas sp. 73-92]
MSAVGALVGLLLGAGCLLLAAHRAARRPALDRRLAPYLRPQRTQSALLDAPATPLAGLGRLAAPFLADAARRVARLGSPTAELRRRLARAGRTESVEQFRVGQVVWGACGLAAGLGAAIVVGTTRGGSPVALAVLVAVVGLLAALARDWLLARAVRVREARLMSELPTVAELLALAVGAGEGAAAALERVARTCGGELAGELRATLADARAGLPLTQALDGLAARTGLPALARFAEGVAVALERGTPLAEVLRAQAQDVRSEGRRALMEAGGRKEILQMLPVVFLVLPVTVLFAVFPSLVVLRVGM